MRQIVEGHPFLVAGYSLVETLEDGHHFPDEGITFLID